MFAPSTRGPQTIPANQNTRGPILRDSRVRAAAYCSGAQGFPDGRNAKERIDTRKQCLKNIDSRLTQFAR